MSDEMVRRWRRMFSEGRTNVHDDDRSGSLSSVTADRFDQVNEKNRENRRFFFRLKRFLAAERFSSIGSKRWRQTSSTRGYRNLCPDMTNVSIWVAIMSRSS
jgi:hypothetical protein